MTEFTDETTKIVQTEHGTIQRQSFHHPDWTLAKVRERVADGDFYSAIGLFSIVYDTFGRKFETFVINDQARRDRGEPVKSEREMAEWLRMLAESAEFYAQALLVGNH
jgi:hypothetical protein